MTTPTPAPVAPLVTMFRADQIEPILRNILQCLDSEARCEDQFFRDKYRHIALTELHDLLAEVAS